MLSKANIKYLHSLQLGKFRQKFDRFIAEGNINVLDFIRGPLTIEKLYATENWLEEHRIGVQHLPCESISQHEMEKITALRNASEVLAIIKKPSTCLPDINHINNYVLALDDIKDPGNMGTIIRTADWFGIHDIICSTETVDVYNPKVVQASMGSLARVRVHYTSLATFFENKPADLQLYGAVLDGEAIQSITKAEKGILLIGSEAHGISQSLYPFIDHRIRIPSAATSGAESLNAAVATALVCYAFINEVL